MNYRMTGYILGQIAIVESILLCIPFILAIVYGDNTILAFGVTIAALVAVGVPFVIKKPKNKDFKASDGFIIVALSWLLMSVFGSLPFFISGHIPHFIDSLFETISGFTTTGASILTNVEALPKSLLFWRSLTHWIGGMGVLVFVIAIIPKSDAKIIHLFRAESPGPQVGKLVSKLKFTARILYGIYIVLTLSEIFALLLCGMNFFDSVIHAFGTAGTGGFSNMNESVGAFGSVAVDTVITVYMLLFSISFNLYYLILIGNIKQALKSEELRTFFGIIFAAVIVISISLTINAVYDTFGETLRYSFFQVASIISTTGFATADFASWPLVAQMVLFMLMFVGACAGSTGGGLKVSRIILLFKSGFRELKKTISPRSVCNIVFENKIVDSGISRGVLSYFTIYMFIFAVSVVLISITSAGTTHGFTNSMSAVNACINNIGPGLGDVGPTGNYSFFNSFSKIVLMFNMLVGRLEVLPMLLLFYPKVWKRA
ncbi:MAG: potassium transporter TrkG [Clostridia bacterium]|nr:potassium transporter TrkG [Clostridia bacterium]